MGITITYTGSSHRGIPKHFDTDQIGEALEKAVEPWYKGEGDEYHVDNTIFAVIIERDDHPLTRREVAQELEEIAKSEHLRAHNEEEGR